MTYILTCGCESQYGGFPSEWDGESRECEPAVFYGCLCDKHFGEYDARPAQYQDNEDKLGTLEEAIEFDKKRNYQYTAPVAWMETYNGHPNNLDWNPDNLRSGDLNVPNDNVYEIVPLYTAPRELSDAEIDECLYTTDWSYDPHSFARAILKKASEK